MVQDNILPYKYKVQKISRYKCTINKKFSNTEWNKISQIVNTKYIDNILNYKYKMQRHYLTLQIINTKMISNLTTSKCN